MSKFLTFDSNSTSGFEESDVLKMRQLCCKVTQTIDAECSECKAVKIHYRKKNNRVGLMQKKSCEAIMKDATALLKSVTFGFMAHVSSVSHA